MGWLLDRTWGKIRRWALGLAATIRRRWRERNTILKKEFAIEKRFDENLGGASVCVDFGVNSGSHALLSF